MKGFVVLVIFVFTIASCGPKRMKCYNKRCVENCPKEIRVNS